MFTRYDECRTCLLIEQVNELLAANNEADTDKLIMLLQELQGEYNG